MKKIANFIVNKRIIILICVLVIAGVCAVLSSQLKINTDMSKYLSDDSNMKQGLDIMDSDFPASDETASIRVMFDDLDKSKISAVKKQLEGLSGASSVEYDANSSDYNKDNHTLFIINTKYEYDSKEEVAIETALSEDFNTYNMTFHNNDVQSSEVPLILLLSAVGIALVILIIMSKSWLEPVLFMATIGIAILINLGTNIIFPYTSDLTSSVAPIIQLALSMDYSIMLMSRYRLEKLNYESKYDAMKAALANSFSSIASSSLTTVVGLLALVFLTFKVGPELGIVLAKGVFISMVCVFTLLPVLILWCDKGIEKSKKKSPKIPMGGFAKFSHKTRFVMPLLLVAMFISFYFIQGNTGITFTEGMTDPLTSVFPKDNMVVMIYNNKDESKINNVIAGFKDDDHIKSIVGYSNTLGEQMTSSEMSKAVGALGSDMKIDKSLVDMVYFLKNNGEMPTLTASQFISFIKNDVLANPTLSANIDDSMAKSFDDVEKYTDKKQLEKRMTDSEMAEFFGMESKDIKNLYLYYFTQNGGVDTGTMTLSEFSDFVINTVATDKTYSSMFDASAASELKTLSQYTNKAEMTKSRSYKDAASVLGMDSDTMKLLYAYYQAQNEQYVPQKMTLAEFVSFMQNDVIDNPMFSSYIDESATEQMTKLATFSDKQMLTKKLTSAELAKVFGMEESQVKSIFYLSWNVTGTMSIKDAVSFMLSNKTVMKSMDEDTKAQINTLQKIIQLVLDDAELSSDEIASFADMDKGEAKLLFTYRDAQNGAFENDHFLTVQGIVNFIVENKETFGTALGENADKLETAQSIINSGIKGTAYNPSELAELVGMDKSQVDSLYLLHQSKLGNTAGWKLTPQQFVSFVVNKILPDKSFSGYFDKSTANDLKTGETLINTVISGKKYSATEMYSVLKNLTKDISQDEIEIMYIYYGGKNSNNPEWKMTIPQMINYLSDELVSDERFAEVLDSKTKDELSNGRATLNDALEQMKGKTYSRLIFTSDYAEESAETNKFMAKLDELRNTNFTNDSYVVGTSAMVYEMENTFNDEFFKITLITALAIFMVVLLAFRNLIIPLLLTLLVQCGVYITVSVVGIHGGTMYYLALLIVQSILMGATIDYGIVFSNYYRECRQTMDRVSALKIAYENSIHTIMTSGSILILVTGILGVFSTSPITSQVCLTIAIGSLIAVLLILLVLPGILDFSDRFVVKKKSKKRFKKSSDNS